MTKITAKQRYMTEKLHSDFAAKSKTSKYPCPKPVPQITRTHRLARAVPINPFEYAAPAVHTEFAGHVVWVAVVHTVVYAVTLLAQTVTV